MRTPHGFTSIPVHLQAWIEARRYRRLSHAQVQMARELGMNPKKLGKQDNHRQEPWKLPFLILSRSFTTSVSAKSGQLSRMPLAISQTLSAKLAAASADS